MGRRTLFSRIIVSNFIIMAIFILSFLLQNYFTVKEQVQALEQNTIESIAKTIEPVITLNLSIGLDNYTELIAHTLKAHDIIERIELRDAQNRVIFELNKDNKKVLSPELKKHKLQIKDTLVQKVLGELIFFHKDSLINEVVMNKYVQYLFVVFLLFFIAVLSLTVATYLNLLPLKKLTKKLDSYHPNDKLELELKDDKSEVSIINNVIKGMLNKIDEHTNKKQAYEKNLAQQNRLASMGEMIANIAHQWRQPLMNINAILMNMDRSVELDKASKKYLIEKIDNIVDITSHMSQTIEDFSTFFKPDKNKNTFSVVESIEDALIIVNSRLKYIDVKLKNECSPLVYGFRGEFMQVMISLINNAIDTLEEKQIESKKLKIEVTLTSNAVVLSIEDNAKGIKKEDIEHIFDPYYTTKHKSGGTGLGLYISKLLIEESMHGQLLVENSKEGAKFSIILKEGV
ncbi:MAG: GHKL domain-containing protein [Helicobacteraceae bacterium]|nr:GHKL domain-containing protein [Helicobacteraceae bacterium]